MRRQEWGLFTLAALLSVHLFPLYFVNVVAIAALGGLGYLWRSLNPDEKDKLLAFERQFRVGHEKELQEDIEGAIEVYHKLAEQYGDVPKIADIASKRIKWLERNKRRKSKKRKRPAGGRRG